MCVFSLVQTPNWTIAFHHFRFIYGLIGSWKFNFPLFLLQPTIRRKISGGVFSAIFQAWLHLAGEIDLRSWANWQIKAQLITYLKLVSEIISIVGFRF